MRINLLPTEKHTYKANLHAHSTDSDGQMSPADLAAAYHDHGYSVLALTDHEYIRDHSDLNRDDFLMITGYELQIVDPVFPRKTDQKCCHLCLLSKDPHHFKHIFFNPEAIDLQRLCKHPEVIPSLEYVGDGTVQKYYDRELIQDIINTANENGFLVAYNHPVWSLEHEDTTLHLDGLYAMEMVNYSCVKLGLDEYNPFIYDGMLRAGHRTGCISTDDCHSKYPIGDPRCDMFGGFTYILADELKYDSIISALEHGDFYASTGPEIKEFYYEDGYVHVKTSPASSISLTTGGRKARVELANVPDTVEEAVFPVLDTDKYIRLTVKDIYGRPANTRGYFLDEFMN